MSLEGGDKRAYAGINLHYGKTQQQVNRLLADWDERKPKVAGIVICDRCNSFGKDDAAGSLTLVRAPRKNDEDKLLCPACINDFDDFMADGKNAPRDGQAFTEPWKPAESTEEAEQSRLIRTVAREFAKASAEYRETPTVDQLLTRIKALESGSNGDSLVDKQKPETD